MRNLAAVWPNFQAAGAARLVLADVVESRDELARYRAAVPGAEILVVRLRARIETLMARLRAREPGAALDRHLQRAADLAKGMERLPFEDLRVETDGRPASAIAHEILARARW
jgi:predicted kinase